MKDVYSGNRQLFNQTIILTRFSQVSMGVQKRIQWSKLFVTYRSSRPEVFGKKGVLRLEISQHLEKNT